MGALPVSFVILDKKFSKIKDYKPVQRCFAELDSSVVTSPRDLRKIRGLSSLNNAPNCTFGTPVRQTTESANDTAAGTRPPNREEGVRIASRESPLIQTCLVYLWFPFGLPVGLLCVCLWFAFGLRLVNLWFAYGLPLVCIWFPFELPLVGLWVASSLHLVCLWFAFGLLLVCLWFDFALRLVYLWRAFALPLVCLWFACGLLVVCIWFVFSLPLIYVYLCCAFALP